MHLLLTTLKVVYVLNTPKFDKGETFRVNMSKKQRGEQQSHVLWPHPQLNIKPYFQHVPTSYTGKGILRYIRKKFTLKNIESKQILSNSTSWKGSQMIKENKICLDESFTNFTLNVRRFIFF